MKSFRIDHIHNKRSLITFLLAFFLEISSVFAQMPQGVPNPSNNSPVDFTSASDIVLYIVLPVVLIVAFFVLRARKRKNRKDDR